MYLPTEDLGILQNSLTCICAFQNELEFEREGETRVPRERPLKEREKTINKLNPHLASTPGFKPEPHW